MGGACIDVFEDEENCGGCGVTCEDGEVCSDGVCTPESTGFPFGGASWYLSEANWQSCAQRCALEGKAYDPATATVAGHLGTNAACESVLTGLGYPGSVTDHPATMPGMAGCYGQYDCHISPFGWASLTSGRSRCTHTDSNPEQGGPGVVKACACQ